MFASEATEVQLIVTLGAVLVALIGAVALVWTQGRRTHGVIVENAGKMDRIEHSINHVDEEPDPLGPPLTLGQLVKQGFTTNEAQHAALGARLDEVTADLTEHTAVDERIEGKVDGLVNRPHNTRSTDKIEVPVAGRAKKQAKGT